MADSNVNASQQTTGSSEVEMNADTTQDTNNVSPEDVCVVEGAQSNSSLSSVIIEMPPEGETLVVNMQAGQKYFIDTHEGDIASYQQEGNDLRLTFEDGSVVILKDYVLATSGDLPSTLAFRDEFSLDLEIVETVPSEDALEAPQEDLREVQNLLDEGEGESGEGEGIEQLEPAAGEEETAEELAQTEPEAGDEAAQLAQIEPAAGEPTGQGPINSGFTFGNPDAAPVAGIPATGPLGATALQYGVDFPTDDVRILEFDTVPETIPSEIALDETGLGPISITDTVVFEFGSNGPGTITTNGQFTFDGSTATTLTSGGVAIAVTNTPTGYIGVAGGVTVFDLVLDTSTGEYTFTQYAPLDHADGTNPNDVINLVFGVVGTDADGDAVDSTITVRIADDAPLPPAPMVENVDETDLTAGPIVINDTLTIDFGQDTPGDVSTNGTSSFTGVSTLTTNGQTITITATATGYVGTYNGGADKAFELTFNGANGAYTYTQYAALDHAAANDIISLQFGVTITDYDGDSAETTITVNIEDSVPRIPPIVPPPGGPDPSVPEIGKGYNIVDETNLPGGSTASGTVAIEFGADLPGTFQTNDTFTSNIALTSNGQTVTVTETANGYVGTINGGADTVFTLVINTVNGDYTFTQNLAIDHPDGTNPDDAIRLSFGVEAADADGDTASGTITIDVKDDGPSVTTPAVLSLNEADITPGPASVTGTLGHDFGADGAGSIDPNGTTSFTGVTTLTSGGEVITITATANGYVGSTASGDVFTLALNSTTGVYHFTLIKPLDHAAGDTAITLNFGVLVTDFDADSVSSNIAIRVVDDKPSIPGGDNPALGAGYEVIDETNLGPISVDGTVPVNFGEDTPATLKITGAPNTILTSGGEAITYVVTDGSVIGQLPNGDVVFTLTLDANGRYEFTQILPLDHPDATNPDDVISLSFPIEVSDSDGDSDTGAIKIDIRDDGPVAVDDTGTIAQNQSEVSGNVMNNDDVGADVNGQITKVTFNGTDYAVNPGAETTVNGQYGTLVIKADGSYTYTSFGTNTTAVTDRFTYTLVDFDGDADTAVLTININDVDFKPVVSADPLAVQESDLPVDTDSNVITANFGQDGPGEFTASGANTFSYSGQAGAQLTSGGVPVTVAVSGNDYVGSANGTEVFRLTLNATTGAYEFTLTGVLDHADTTNPADLITLNFGVTAKDADGDTTPVTVKVTVTDDGPVATDDFNTVPQNTTSVNGNVLTNDDAGADGDAAVTKVSFNGTEVAVTAAGTTVNGQYGTLVIKADGSYTYTSYGTNANSVVDKFTYTMVDGDGDTDKADLTINVADVDSDPILATPAPLTVDETDLNPTDSDSNVVRGDFGYDGPGTYTVSGTGSFSFSGQKGPGLTSGGVAVNVTVEGNDYVGKANGTEVFRLSLNSTTGEYEFILKGVLDHADTTNPDDIIKLNFGVTASDTDGDKATGTIVVNVKDDGPVAHDDVNTIDVQVVNQDYNVVFVLDVSGSMDGSRLDILKASVGNMLQSFNGYNAGQVKVFITPFATDSQGGQAFDVSTTSGLNAALNYLNGLSASGLTNYEAPLQTAISWLQSGEPISGADTYTYFISDGEPNRYNDNNGNDQSGNVNQIIGEITGSDGSNEVATLKGLSTEVIGVGIAVNSTALNVIATIDSDGQAIDVRNPNDLDSALQNTNPIQGSTLGNVITGLNGGTNAADNLSEDTDNVVTKISFNGVEYAVTAAGTSVNGQYGTLVIKADGSYTYKLGSNLTPGAAIQDVFLYTLTDGDGDNSTAKLTIQANIPADDQPVITTVETLIVDETDLNPNDTDSGTITANFGNDGPGEYLVSGPSTFSYTGAKGSNLTSHGVPVTVTLDGNDYVGKANGTEIFRLSLNKTTGSYSFTLKGVLDHADATNPDDIIKLNFGVIAKDSDGDIDAGTITVNVKDDGPVAVADSRSVDEGKSVNGNVLANDDAGEDVPGTVTSVRFGGTDYTVTTSGTTINGQYGTLVIKADGSYTYTAKSVSTSGQDVFTYTLKDYDGDAAQANLTVSIKDADDVPVISSVTPLVTDDSDLNPTDSASGQITASFGDDGPGTFEVRGTSSFSFNGAKNNTLSSGGVAIVISVAGNEFIGKAGNVEVFRLSLNPTTGQYTFVQKAPLDHANASNPDDAITLNFGVAAKDADGDTTPANIVVTVKDDGPSAVDDFGTIVQNQNAVSGNVMANDDVGADVAGSITNVRFGGTDYTVTSAGTTINGQYGKLVIKSDGSYTYTANGSNTSAVSDQFTYTLSDKDGDKDTAVLKININDVNDKPVVATPAPLVVDETDLNPTDTDNGTISATFGNDGPGEYLVGNPGSFSYSGQAGTKLTSNGVEVKLSVSGNDYVGKAGSVEVFRLVLNKTTGQYEFILKDQLDHGNPNNPDDIITLNFQVAVKDADGDVTNGTIKVSVKDDGPVAVDDGNTVAQNQSEVFGNVMTNDDVGADLAGTITKISFGGTEKTVTPGVVTLINGQYGKLEISANGSYKYTANGSNTSAVMDQFTYTLSDADGDKDTAVLKININDVDDRPDIATPAPLVVDETDLNPTDSDSNTVTADFGTDGPGTYVVSGAGSVSYSGQAGTKLTSNGVEVVISVSGNDYVGKAGGKEVFRLSLNSTTGQYTFTLKDQLDHANPNNPNDVITLNFGVGAKDADGDIDAGTIVVSVYDDGPDAVNDVIEFDAGDLTYTGNVLANDDPGADEPGTVSKIVFGGTEYTVSGSTATVINTGSATLSIKANGSYTYTLKSATGANPMQDFTYTLKDADGDKDTATLSFKPLNPTLIVGSNDDDDGSTGRPWTVGGGEGEINGGRAGDILVGDYGGSNQIAVNKDYNFLFVLDVSGSMEANTPLGTRIQLLIDAVQNLITDFSAYQGGEVLVHFAPFSTTAEPGATFKVTDVAGLQGAIAWLESLEPNGLTNYEAALQSGIDWLQSGELIPGAETITYFVSDGEPNRYVTPDDDSNSGSAAEVMAQVTGSDGSNEVAIIQSLSDEVIGVGIDISSSIANINIIDSDGKSLNIEDPTELNAALAGSNPINRNIAVGDDDLNGGDGDDLIFGDALFTDVLAANQGLSTAPGSGWEVFQRLENGEGSKADWTREDTINYIKANAVELSQESLNTSTDQAGRQGGDDTIRGGAGNDIIFGQEGDDVIYGGAGNDHLYGGTGNDIFVFEAGGGVDTIHDFEFGKDVLDISALLQGYDALQDSINDFVFLTEVNGNTVVSVDANGSAGGNNSVNVAVLQSVTGLDLDDISALTHNGEAKV